MPRDNEKQKRAKRDWYHRNKLKVVQQRVAVERQMQEYIESYKSSIGCKICGEMESVCLDFHHVNPESKLHNVGRIKKYRQWEKLYKEIEKCVVVCANCHRKIHAGILSL